MTYQSVLYNPETLEMFKGNPLIEVLPPRADTTEIIRRLTHREPYEEEEVRNKSPEDRGMLVQTLMRLYQPAMREVDIYHKIDRCIRWGYADRNPLSPQFIRQQQHEYAAQSRNQEFIRYTQSYPTTNGFALLGTSGLGKSTTIRRILGCYPQVVRHTCYQGQPFNETQISWIHMDCPNDGSLKGLCGAFFEQVDSLLGTDYFSQYDEKRATLNKMRIAMARIARTYHLGVIVIDEIQALAVAKDESVPVKTLNFLVSLVNTIGVPVILVGTPRALAFLQKEFQQAKRASGQGDALWEHMENDIEWRRFVKAIWKYQYTRKKVELADQLIDALYEEAIGIPFLAVSIYKLVQEFAIYSGKETFTAQSFHTIASQKMRLTREMRAALRSGKEINLQQYLDLTPFKLEDFKQAAESINPPEPPAPAPIAKPDLREATIQALLTFGITRPEGMKLVNRAIAKNPSCTHSTILAREAYSLYLQASTAQIPLPASSSDLPALSSSYAENKANGFIGF